MTSSSASWAARRRVRLLRLDMVEMRSAFAASSAFIVLDRAASMAAFASADSLSSSSSSRTIPALQCGDGQRRGSGWESTLLGVYGERADDGMLDWWLALLLLDDDAILDR